MCQKESTQLWWSKNHEHSKEIGWHSEYLVAEGLKYRLGGPLRVNNRVGPHELLVKNEAMSPFADTFPVLDL